MKRRKRSRSEIEELLVAIDRKLDHQSLNEICEFHGIHRSTVHRWRKACGLTTTSKATKLKGANEDKLAAYMVAAEQNLVCATRRSEVVKLIQQKLGWSERRACRAVGQNRSTQRYQSLAKQEKKRLQQAVVQTKDKNPEWGARKIAVVVSNDNPGTNRLRPEAMYYRLELATSLRRRTRVASSGDALKRASVPNQIWACDITRGLDIDGRPMRWMAIVDEFTRECLALRVRATWSGVAVAKELSALVEQHGNVDWIRTDNEDLWKSRALNQWLAENHIGHRLIRHGAPWENGVVESFFSQLRRELLNKTQFCSVVDADAQAKAFQDLYNFVRPHGAIDWQTPNQYRQETMDRISQSESSNEDSKH